MSGYPLEGAGQAFALERQRPAHHVLKDGVSGQHDAPLAQQIHQFAQNVHRPAGYARSLPGVRFEHDPLLQGTETVADPSEDRFDVAFASVVRYRQINDGLVVEVASTQIVDIVADGRESVDFAEDGERLDRPWIAAQSCEGPSSTQLRLSTVCPH